MNDLLSQLQGSLQMLANHDVQLYLLKGTAFTIGISVIIIVCSVLIGSVLALVRNYCTTGPARLARRVHHLHRAVPQYPADAVDIRGLRALPRALLQQGLRRCAGLFLGGGS